MCANIKESKELAFDDCPKWKEMHVVLTIPVSNGYLASVLKEIWDSPIKISVSSVEHNWNEGRYKFTENCLGLEINYENKFGSIRSQMNIRCDLVNMQPFEKNESFCFKITYEGRTSKNLKKIDDLKKASNGFIHEGNIFLIVHLYMSEPNKA